MIETFVPLFGQKLGLVSPLVAGFLGAVPAIGWTVAQFFSSSVRSDRTKASLCVIGPVVTVAGMGVIAIGGVMTGPWALWWLPALAAIGVGVGLAFPHLVVAAMSLGTNERESAQASAGISVVQLLSNTVFTALCGLLLATSVPGLAASQVMATGLVVVLLVAGLLGAWGLRRTR